MTSPWWRDAVVYEIYVRSFADASGDGVGDLPGVTSRLPYLAELGVDAIWLTPFYTSPMADGGYDVADYRDVDPRFGTLADFDALIEAAHGLGLRVMIDIVPNHSSIEHPWFQEALRGVKRDRYIFRQTTNDWQSVFGGPAWTQVADGSSYLHLFAPEQPDFNWRNPEVHAEFLDVLRFWLDRGVDGFRIDVANGLYKAEDLPDTSAGFVSDSPMSSRPEVHGVYREWRALMDTYPGDRAFVGEVWTDTPEDLALYVRPDELHQSFNFAWLKAPWSADAFRAVIDKTLTEIAAPTWVLSNHDVVRHVTRYGEGSLSPSGGVDRAKAALLAMLALPGSAYLYQGEELGLPEVVEIPPDRRQDPTFFQTGGKLPGRDGCRVPLPWSGSSSPYGFGTGEPWLPQPSSWALLTAERQSADPTSTLSFYKAALAWRKQIMSGDGIEWLPGPADTLFFRRGSAICAVNCGDEAVPLPDHKEIVLATTPLTDGLLPPDGGAWLLT